MERTTPVSAPVLVNIETRTPRGPRLEREQPRRGVVMSGTSLLRASRLIANCRCGLCGHLRALRPNLHGES